MEKAAADFKFSFTILGACGVIALVLAIVG
jgi:hypothetical protein